MIIEDEKEISDGIEYVLQRENYTTDAVYGGLSGLDILKNVREQGLDVPIILLTAKPQSLDVATGLDLSVDDYITKPFEVSEVLARIPARTRVSKKSKQNVLSFCDISFFHKGFASEWFSVWIQTAVLCFPMAFFLQVFFVGPFVRFVFRMIFKTVSTIKLKFNCRFTLPVNTRSVF